MKRTMTLLASAALAVSVLAGCGGVATPIPQDVATSAKAAAPKAAAPKASTCDVAREAILTGTPTDIEKAFRALVADKSADGTAREYARYYLGRDKNDKSMREMDISLIQMSCTV